MYRNTYVKIDNETIKNNIREIIKKYSHYKYYIGVVKANAYGHGIYVVDSMISGGINYLAVSSLEEAIDIRKYNKDIPILVLEPINLDYINIVNDNNITITVDSLVYINELIKKNNHKIKVHIKIDSGMNRLGFKEQSELDKAYGLLNNDKNIFIEGIFTHIGTSGLNDEYYEKSINNFIEITRNIDLLEIPIVHINRSITLVHHEKLPFETGVRLGIVMYGFNQSVKNPTGLRRIKRNIMLKKLGIEDSILENDLKLKTAFILYSEVMAIKKIKKGEYVGYGANYIAKKDALIAIVSIGYFDGVDNTYKYVSVNKKLYNIIGDVCMDMLMIEIDESVKLHDTVEIFGDNISVGTVSKNTGKNAYHLFTGITTRVPRVYSDNTEIKY